MPTVESRTRSRMTRSFSDSSFIAAPPYFTTTVSPAKRCRYGNASARTETLWKLSICACIALASTVRLVSVSAADASISAAASRRTRRRGAG
eukprot:30621-Pelagococcus_subviridis.AAC.6